MSLQESITSELKSAIKSRDTARTSAIRVLIGEFQRQPDKELSDNQVIAIIKKLVKSEQELLQASGEGVSDFITILETYLPRQASVQEITTWIQGNIDFSAFKNRMQAMKPIMAHFGNTTDGNKVKQILQTLPD